MTNEQIDYRLRALEERLARIERSLDLNQEAAPSPPEAAPASETLPAAAPVVVLEQGSETTVEAVRPPPLPPPLPVMPYAPSVPLPPPLPRAGLEQTIGLKWAGWIGAIVLVIGAGLGIKFAVDQGWLGQVPPGVRLILMYIGGFAILGAGEIVYRRINAISAAAVFGAGVATLFLVSYAGHGLYKLYDPEKAFILMGASTLIGAAVAVRGRLVSIAIVSLIGGNIAPAVLGGEPRLVPFLSYLLMLQVVALILAWWGERGKWWILRSFALVTTSLWMIGVLGTRQFDQSNSPLIFTLIYAALFQIELIASSIRARRNPAAQAAGGTIFSMVVTALAVAAVLHIYRDASPGVRGAWVIGFSATCAIVGFALRWRGPIAMSVSYRIQAAALLVVAVPVALSGAWITVAWGVLGLAFAALGASLNLDIARTAGVATWMLALANLYHWSADRKTARDAADVWLRLLGQGVPAYAILAWVMTWVGHGVAWLVATGEDESSKDRRRWAEFTAIVAGLVWIAASIAALPPLGATALIVLYAWLMLGIDLLPLARKGIRPLWHVAGALVVAAVKWMLVDTLIQRLSPNWSATQYQPFLNPAMAIGVVIALSLLAAYGLRRRQLNEMLSAAASAGDRAQVALVLSVLAIIFAIFTLGLSLEIDRVIEQRDRAAMLFPPPQVKQLSWTMLWMTAICGFIALAAKIEPSPSIARRRSRTLAVLPMLLTIKFLLIDTLLFRVVARSKPAAMVGINLQTLAALFVLGGLLWTYALCRRRDVDEDVPSAGRAPMAIVIGFLAILVLLWTGSLEIDRYFETYGSGRAKQVALSIFWGVFAVGSVVAGFRVRVAGLRYFGLGLFAVTLLKVVMVDLAHIGQGYRILSFLGLGLLLLGTSVLYGKLSPKLLGEEVEAPDER